MTLFPSNVQYLKSYSQLDILTWLDYTFLSFPFTRPDIFIRYFIKFTPILRSLPLGPQA